MKVYVEVVDSKTGIYQTGMIDEPVVKGHEIQNALMHFGVVYGEVIWEARASNYLFGKVENTTKLISIIYI